MEMPRRYDLQVHTDASPCSSAAPEAVVDAAVATGLDGIAVTDHDTVVNVPAVRDAAPDGLDVISGVEVTTTQGHLLALGVESPPPRDTPLAVIQWVHDRGGVAVLSHPFDTTRQYYDHKVDDILAAVDAVEGVNSRCILSRFNEKAKRMAAKHAVATTGGSDGHFPMEVGRAYTKADGEILPAIQSGDVEPAGRGGYLSGHVATKAHQLRRVVRG